MDAVALEVNDVLPPLPDEGAEQVGLAEALGAGGADEVALPPPTAPETGEISIDGEDMVSCLGPPSHGEAISKITTAGKNWFVTCFLHYNCKTARSYKRYTKPRAARWLTLAQPCSVPCGQHVRLEEMERVTKVRRCAWDRL